MFVIFYIQRSSPPYLMLLDGAILRHNGLPKTPLFIIRSRRLWSSLHGLGWIGAISQVTLN